MVQTVTGCDGCMQGEERDGRYFASPLQWKRHALYYSVSQRRGVTVTLRIDKQVCNGEWISSVTDIRCSFAAFWIWTSSSSYVSIVCITIGAKGVQTTSGCIPEDSCLLGCFYQSHLGNRRAVVGLDRTQHLELTRQQN